MALPGTYNCICGSDNDLHRLEKGCDSNASVITSWRFFVAICIAIVAGVATFATVACIAFARFTPVQFLAADVWSPESCTPMSVSGKTLRPSWNQLRCQSPYKMLNGFCDFQEQKSCMSLSFSIQATG